MWFLKTRNHMCYHSLAFSNSVLSWMVLLANPGVFSPQSIFRVLTTLFSFCLSTGLSDMLLVCPCAFSTDLLVGFSFFILECILLFVLLNPVSVSSLSHRCFKLSLQVVLSDLSFFLPFHFNITVVMLTKERHGEQKKGLIENIYKAH